MVLAHRDTIGYAGLSALYWIVQTLAIEVTNRLSDRREDEVNRPERTRLCEHIGWGRLKALQLGLWCAVVAIDIVWLILAGNPELALLLAGVVGVGFGYSRGPRLARVRHVGLLVVNLVFGGAFIVGWSVGNPLSQPSHIWLGQLTSCLPILGTVGVFIVTLVGVKDLTDRAGDLRVGYRSPFVDLIERKNTSIIRCLAGLPFALILVFVLLGLVPARLVALMAFAPVSAVITEALRHVRTSAEAMIVREFFYNYWLVFSSSALLLLLPSKALALAIAGAVAYWILTTRLLHWGEQLRVVDLGELMRMSRWSAKQGVSAR